MTSKTRLPRFVPAVDEMPGVVAWAQTPVGRGVLLVLFTAGLRLHRVDAWLELAALLSVVTFWPGRRRALIAAGTVYWWFRHLAVDWVPARTFAESAGFTGLDWTLLAPGAVLTAAAAALGVLVVVRSPLGRRWLRRPVAALLATHLVLLAVALHAPLPAGVRVALFTFLLAFTHFIWFTGYALIHREPDVPPLLQVGRFLPFFAPGATPLPKAAGYLSKIEAKSAEGLAVCQLKALKLLFWAGLLVVLSRLMRAAAFGTDGGLLASAGWTLDLGIPKLAQAVAAHAAGEPLAWAARASSLVHYFLSDLVLFSIWGHLLIASVRMAGFKALRNTCRPLSSGSVAEFWNRYYFYYKELLLDFFFYPAFLRYFKRRPVLRRFFATLCAATFGNVLFHVIRDIRYTVAGGLPGLLYEERMFAFYALLLGLGIGVSQLRSRRSTPPAPSFRTRWIAPLGVMAFYCSLSVFLVKGEATLFDRITFVLALFGGSSS